MNVSRICMGCMGFGYASRGQHRWTIDEEHSREIIKRGLDLGVNFYDTAIAYQSGTSEQDAVIIDRVAELAEKHSVTMTEVSLAWLLTKVTSPVVGATKLHHIEGAAKAIDVKTKCIITVVSLMASGITDSSLTYHLQNAKAHGVTKEEIAAIITHATMYVGWPKGWAVFRLAKEVWNEE